MRKVFGVVAGLLLSGALLGGIAHAACMANGLICYDESRLYFNAQFVQSMTLSQMNSATPGYTGQLIIVSDGVQSKVCISSGTGNGAYTVFQATAPGAGILQHCS